jgi:hypothetical protein
MEIPRHRTRPLYASSESSSLPDSISEHINEHVNGHLDTMKKLYPNKPLRDILKTINSLLSDQPRNKSTGDWLHDTGYGDMDGFMRRKGFKIPDELHAARKRREELRQVQQEQWEARKPAWELMKKKLEDELRKPLEERRAKIEEYRQDWLKQAPEREKKELAEKQVKIAEHKAKGKPLPRELLDTKAFYELTMREYQITRAQLWHWRYEHCSFNELQRIYVPRLHEFLFKVDDFKIYDVPECQYCKVLGQYDRGPLTDTQQRLWQAVGLARPLGWDYRSLGGVNRF